MRTKLFSFFLLLFALGGLSVRGIGTQEATSAVPPVPTDLPAEAVRYAVLLSGNRAGLQASWKEADGTWNTIYEFNDRGRGPKQRTTLRLGPDGIPTPIDIAGHD